MEPFALLNILKNQHKLDVNILNLKSFTPEGVYEAVEYLGDADYPELEKRFNRKRKSKDKTVSAVIKYLNSLSPRRSYSLHGVTELKILEVIKHDNTPWTKKTRKPHVSRAGFLRY